MSFQREDRYVVLKRRDLEKLSMTQKHQLDEILQTVNEHRTDNGKDQLTCVVVERDWANVYDQAWKLIQEFHTQPQKSCIVLSQNETRDIRQAIGLLNSMVCSGEDHSDLSLQVIENALTILSGKPSV